ncbi:LysR family transcriptional regulator [Nostoc sp.]|uniref:LysR family transcriptional regulator n=1 Tax=Nostoc sp. TaxID=1180 RepID=UPI002FFCCA63
MKRDELNDLAAFVVVADEMSFTRAAAKLEMSPSALSHAMKTLEDRLGLRLLVRTTRHVSTTEAGIRLGEKIARDMVAVQVGSEIRTVVVGSPAYFADHPTPTTPQDLARHCCINYRFTTSGGLYPWAFQEEGRTFQVRVDGSLVFNDGDLILAAVLAGHGIAYLFEDQVVEHVAQGRLIQVLQVWCSTLPGYYLYHPNRRQTPTALTTLIDVLRVP